MERTWNEKRLLGTLRFIVQVDAHLWVLSTGNHGHEVEDTCCRYTAVGRFEVDHGLGLCQHTAYLCRSYLEDHSGRLVDRLVVHPFAHPVRRLCDHYVDRLGDRTVEVLIVEVRAVEHRNARPQEVEHQRPEHQSEGHPYPRPSHPLLLQSRSCHLGTRDLLVFYCGLTALSGYRIKALDHG